MSRSRLHAAAADGNDGRLSRLLLTHSTDVNATDDDGNAPLHLAARYGRKACVERLLNSGAVVNLPGKDGATPLHMVVAACTGIYERYGKDSKLESRRDIIKLLVDQGADVDLRDQNGDSALHLARRHEAALLVAHSENVDAVNKLGHTPLLCAARRGDKEDVLFWLNNKCNVNFSDGAGWTPLHYAVYVDDEECFKLLLSKNADVNVKNRYGKTLLHCAAEEGAVEYVRLLLSAGAEVNASNREGLTPLHCAAYGYGGGEGEGCLRLLLEGGADVELRDTKNGYTALHLAASSRRGQGAIVTLLEHGVDINSLSDPIAVSPGQAWSDEEWLRIFGASKSDLMISEGIAKTPLHVAAEKGQEENVLVLLAHGADVNIRCGEWTPHMHAERHSFAGALKRHMVLLKTANMFVNESDLKTLNFSERETKAYQSECADELTLLKTTRIGYSSVTFYDFLSKEPNECAALYKKANVEGMHSDICTDVLRFRNYGRMIKYRLVLARERFAVLKNAFPFLADVFSMLPLLCTEKITDYLENSDLKRLCVSTSAV